MPLFKNHANYFSISYALILNNTYIKHYPQIKYLRLLMYAYIKRRNYQPVFQKRVILQTG
jgi:hypothetical protein